ncbi:hypothetical protein BGZ94_002937 [Podila epigama]|nr:hypothetical protein BGZ94_002937 [Podila epigama]
MERIDKSLDEIIKIQKEEAVSSRKQASNRSVRAKQVPTNKRTRTIQKDTKSRLPYTVRRLERPIRKEKALFTESFKAMKAPIKEIFTAHYVPKFKPITMVAVNKNPVRSPNNNSTGDSLTTTKPDHPVVKNERSPTPHAPSVGRNGRSVYRPADSYRPGRGSNRTRRHPSQDRSRRPNNDSSQRAVSPRHTSHNQRNGGRRRSSLSSSNLDPVIKTEREVTPSLSTNMDVDYTPTPAGRSILDESVQAPILEPVLDNEPATIEIENLDPGTTAEDVKVVCSRFGEIKSCMCVNGFSQVTYARRAAAVAAVQNLNGKTADNDQILRVTLKKTPVFHNNIQVNAPVHVPSPIAEPLKLVGKTVQGSINQVGELYADQLLVAQQMLKAQEDRLAQLHMEEQRLAQIRSQQMEVETPI